MESFLNFFLEKTDKNQSIIYKKARALTIILLSVALLMIVLVSFLFMRGSGERAVSPLLSFVGIIGTLILIKSGRYRLSADILSFFLIAVVQYSLFTTEAYSEPFYFFIHFYLFITFMLFSAMFARRWVFFTLTGMTIASALLIYNLRFDLIPENVLDLAKYGIIIYIASVTIIAILGLVFTGFVDKAMGDLDKSFQESQKQNKMLDNLVKGAKKSTNELHQAGSFLTKVSESVSQNAERQSVQIQQISSQLQEMVESILQNSENSEHSYKKFKLLSDSLNNYQNEISEAIGMISAIFEKSEEISDIAFQTNILALNASIESSKAKKYGKGFAVVADGVRKLSKKSTQISNEITGLTKAGVKISDKLKNSMQQTLKETDSTLEVIQKMSETGITQQSGARNISGSVKRLEGISSENTNAAEKMAQNAKKLTKLAANLKSSVNDTNDKP